MQAQSGLIQHGGSTTACASQSGIVFPAAPAAGACKTTICTCFAYLQVNNVAIPTADIASVRGTPFDFTSPHAVGERIDDVPGKLGVLRTGIACSWLAFTCLTSVRHTLWGSALVTCLVSCMHCQAKFGLYRMAEDEREHSTVQHSCPLSRIDVRALARIQLPCFAGPAPGGYDHNVVLFSLGPHAKDKVHGGMASET